jgi:hypothetical protein
LGRPSLLINKAMGYYIDLAMITLDDYRAKLASAYLPPSRMMLKDKLDERFAIFKKAGIQNVKELLLFLKKKDQTAELSTVERLPAEYLTLLLRELNSLQPKPTNLADFAGIPQKTLAVLSNMGIKNTLHLYEKVLAQKGCDQLAASTGICYDEILELAKLSDLSRIKWVGASYARMLYDLGIDTVAKVATSDPCELHPSLNRYIKDKEIFKGQIGLNDVRILVEVARDLL